MGQEGGGGGGNRSAGDSAVGQEQLRSARRERRRGRRRWAGKTGAGGAVPRATEEEVAGEEVTGGSGASRVASLPRDGLAALLITVPQGRSTIQATRSGSSSPYSDFFPMKTRHKLTVIRHYYRNS